MKTILAIAALFSIALNIIQRRKANNEREKMKRLIEDNTALELRLDEMADELDRLKRKEASNEKESVIRRS